MRICATCGRENPDDADFCVCGEYLRWEPTNYVQAVAGPGDSRPAAVADRTETAPETSTPERPEASDPAVTLAPAAVPATAAGSAALTLRRPDGENADGQPVAVEVEPGARVTILGLIRNQSEVVDNFDLSVRGLPEDWWTVTPATVYLVPYGTGGTYEQEVEVHLHPPRSPQAESRIWELTVVAHSKAQGGTQAASAPLALGI
ncbi:MAG: hypothetical protein ACTHMY_13275, partial [Solirubrobacteraceae bacterium]